MNERISNGAGSSLINSRSRILRKHDLEIEEILINVFVNAPYVDVCWSNHGSGGSRAISQ